MLDVLAFAPHPDDAELGGGGTLILLSSLGYKVGVVDLTEGEMGTRGDAQTRSGEKEKASRVLGLRHREGLRLPDMGLCRTDRGQLESVVRAMRKSKAAVVLAPHWQDRHPDHVEGSFLVAYGFFLSAAANFCGDTEPFKPAALAYYQGSVEFDPTFVVDVSGRFEKKMEAVRCYASQFSPRSAGETETDISHPFFLERVKARARHYGLMVGVEYGEPFFMKRPVGVRDPFELLAGRRKR